MFSKIFIKQVFKSYISFGFTYTYTCYRFKIIKMWWYLPPPLPPKNKKISKSYLKPLRRSYLNIKESQFFSKESLGNA